jgi:hypothetical protein
MNFRYIKNLYLVFLSLSFSNLHFTSIASAEPILYENYLLSAEPSKDDGDLPVVENGVAKPAGESSKPTVDSKPVGDSSTIKTTSKISCVKAGGKVPKYTTIVQQERDGEMYSAVLFTWKTVEFGTNFTPKDRCEIVSNKFDGFLQDNGGEFANIDLTDGIVNGYPVVCMKKSAGGSCNVLFTPSRKNRANVKKLIESLKAPGKEGSSVINESSSDFARVNLGEWAKRNLSAKVSNSVSAPFKKPMIRNSGGIR